MCSTFYSAVANPIVVLKNMAMSSMLMVYAIGDIHGSLRALCRLVAECERDADGRPMRLVFIGDYIDRGPDSRGVVDCIMCKRDLPHGQPRGARVIGY